MDYMENTFSSSSSIVARELVAVEPCLFRGHYLVTGLHATMLCNLFVVSCETYLLWWLIEYFSLFPVSEHLGKQLEDYVSTLPVPVYVLRTEKRSGLIRARLLGAKHVKGQVITFLDAHCECTEGWLEPLLARIVEDR
jgi:hypothetical protein